ncbi:unnamed protein product [Linum tenue]|uniref:Expansin-like EG45 domain-containing protein n=1 Tax=Linum tenue TaxID=586396 RepID=A0AAV0JPW3_9ROSI|nr:unnamed protein product [Linum tenue]
MKMTAVVYVLALLAGVTTSRGGVAAEEATAMYYASLDGIGGPTGACGYGEIGLTYNMGYVAAVSDPMWNNGLACGSCYQVTCNVSGVCNSEGVRVVVTDAGNGDGSNRTAFVLSQRALQGMAVPAMALQLTQMGPVGINYHRVPCVYPGAGGSRKLAVKVTDESRFPDYLSVVLLYQAGEYDLLEVKVLDRTANQWIGVPHSYGAVFALADPPTASPVTLLLEFKGEGKEKGVFHLVHIPQHWTPGAEYETRVSL